MTTETPTLTTAPETFPLTDELRAWATAHTPHVADLAYECDRWLQRCRAKHYVFLDWAEEFKSWLIDADYRARQHGHRPTMPTATSASIQTDAPRCRVTCSFAGCDAPPCGHSQACRGHACCPECAAATAEVTEAPPAVEGTPVAVAAVLAQAFARSHTMSPAERAPRPLGSDPPRLTLRSQLRALLAESDQPLYEQLIAARRAREAAQPAATGGPPGAASGSTMASRA